jgi:PKD repeat protein
VTDKNYATSGALLLDNVDGYLRKTPGYWYAYVNDVYKDGYNNPAGGLNLIALADGDKVEFYYAAGITDPADLAVVKAAATAAVKTVASTGVTPTDWSIVLDGAKTQTVTKSYFEDGLACSSSGHQVFWTDGDGNVWGGVPLWLLVAMVDDDPDVGPDHFNLNDDLAAQHYEVKVIGSDGWSAVFDSANIARSGNYLVVNTLNDEPLPMQTDAGKLSWPLFLKGASVLGGQQVGGIARIELNNLPQPPSGWTLSMLGEVGDVITQEEFEEGLACPIAGHSIDWTDTDGNVWSGMPLWLVLGAVDDIENSDSYTFNDDVAAAGYTVKVTASDGFSKTFDSAVITRNDNYIVANEMNGQPLEASVFPLRLVGAGVTRTDGTLGGSAVGKIVQIEILELQTPPAAPGSYNLAVKGKITDVFSQVEIEQGLACPSSGHLVTWTQQIKDANGNVIETHEWSGIPLWFLAGWVDDRVPHEFNAVQAAAGYKITVKASDGYAKDFQASDVAWSNNYIIATMKDGAPLPTDKWPLQLVGNALARADGTLGGTSVSKIAEIELTEFGVPTEIPKVHIVKYGADGTTVVAETTVDYTQLQGQFPVIGDGVTQYRYQGTTMDPEDIWGVTDETKGGFKIINAVKGTRVSDLVSLVGGMGEGTDIVFVASDNFKTTLPYTSIFTTPAIQARQGDAILAWFADGKYVPGYADGMRLFFMPEDTIYGQWDMHETMPPGYWHYYYQSYSPSDPVYGKYAPGILYPSAAGLSAKYVTEIRVYSTPESSWDLHLDGTRVGGIEYTIAKGYFEAALACQMGANHEASYTDTKEPPNTWIGMPLWFLAGFVDDADQHSNNAYNEELAQAGYDVVVIGSDDYTKVFDSVLTIRSNDFLVANTKNGAHILESETTSWPLKLVGAQATGGKSVGGIHTIILNYPPMPALITVPSSINVGSAMTASGTFTESDMDNTHTVKWDWGDSSVSDGSVDEAVKSVAGSHVYTVPGTYTVKFTVTDGPGSARTSDSATVTVVLQVPVADFTATPTSGAAPLEVQFTDASTGATSWSWTFGDGATSTEKSPKHTYSSPGTYTVSLTATNEAGASSKDLKIVVTTQPPIADFTATPTSGKVPLTVQFTDASTGATSWSWTFGDGATSTEKSPKHIYKVAGTYTATLSVKNEGGSSEKQVTITVQPQTVKKPVAKFTQDKYSGKVPLTITFTDKSTNSPTSYLWRFGDGSTSTDRNPSHTYTKVGVYLIRLTVTNSAGSDSTTGIVAVLPKWWWN